METIDKELKRELIEIKTFDPVTVYPERWQLRVNAMCCQETFNTDDIWKMFPKEDGGEKEYSITPHLVTIKVSSGKVHMTKEELSKKLDERGLREALPEEFAAWRRFNQDMPPIGRIYCPDYRICVTSGKIMLGIQRMSSDSGVTLGLFYHSTNWVDGDQILAVEK